MKTYEEISSFFSDCGGTDYEYLRTHFERFKSTFEFVFEGGVLPGTILDIGAHWLHLSAFFSDGANKIIAADAPITLKHHFVESAAKRLNIQLMQYTRLDLAQGIINLHNDSVDIILMSEIIEHLAFNPLVLWKEIHRVLRNGGRIYITTPNSMYYRSLIEIIDGITSKGEIGCRVEDIFNTGTYGHHWKEYSMREFEKYFLEMDGGFTIMRSDVKTLGKTEDEERQLCETAIQLSADPQLSRAVNQKIESMGLRPFGNQIFLEVGLNKDIEFTKAPPWYVE